MIMRERDEDQLDAITFCKTQRRMRMNLLVQGLIWTFMKTCEIVLAHWWFTCNNDGATWWGGVWNVIGWNGKLEVMCRNENVKIWKHFVNCIRLRIWFKLCEIAINVHFFRYQTRQQFFLWLSLHWKNVIIVINIYLICATILVPTPRP